MKNSLTHIVLYQPVASDIRKIIAVYRMTINLERIGDLVINIIDSIENIKMFSRIPGNDMRF